MLQVSDMLEVARGQQGTQAVRANAPQRFSQRPPVVVWNVCQHCNMACPHCYAAASMKPAPTDLSTEEGLTLLEQMAAAGIKILIFSGGEPLLRPDLFQLIERARDLGLTPFLSTNGVLIDPACAARLKQLGVAYVGISIDGPAAFNDDYRGLEGGYEAALNGLRNAKAAGMRTGLRMTLIERNEPFMEEMLQVAADAGVDRFYVSHLLYSGRGVGMASEDLSRADARGLLDRLFELADANLTRDASIRVVTGSNDSDGVYLLRWITARYGEAAAAPVEELLRARGGNSAGEGILNIDARGRVHPDQFWRSATLGDVREVPFGTILEHPLRAELRDRTDKLKGRCGACAYQALCRGSHRERALAAHGDMWASDPACVMTDDEIGLAADVLSAEVLL